MCKPYMGRLRYFYVPLMEVIVVEIRVEITHLAELCIEIIVADDIPLTSVIKLILKFNFAVILIRGLLQSYQN